MVLNNAIIGAFLSMTLNFSLILFQGQILCNTLKTIWTNNTQHKFQISKVNERGTIALDNILLLDVNCDLDPQIKVMVVSSLTS